MSRLEKGDKIRGRLHKGDKIAEIGYRNGTTEKVILRAGPTKEEGIALTKKALKFLGIIVKDSDFS